jgi:hypothetical protein
MEQVQEELKQQNQMNKHEIIVVLLPLELELI